MQREFIVTDLWLDLLRNEGRMELEGENIVLLYVPFLDIQEAEEILQHKIEAGR